MLHKAITTDLHAMPIGMDYQRISNIGGSENLRDALPRVCHFSDTFTVFNMLT